MITDLLKLFEAPELANSKVIAWSSPVPVFGEIETADVATVGINPSNREFVDASGLELTGDRRRFHTLQSLGLKRWADADGTHIECLAESCKRYFDGNPYDLWFKKLDILLTGVPASFYPPLSNACHLDLVPYATELKWTELTPTERKTLMNLSASALARILLETSIDFLVLNGRSVVEQFEIASGARLKKFRMPSWTLPRKSGRGVAGYGYTGTFQSFAEFDLPRKIRVVGYNHNIQSSFGVTNEVIASIRDWITQQYKSKNGSWRPPTKSRLTSGAESVWTRTPSSRCC
jgi:hypothetical protein